MMCGCPVIVSDRVGGIMRLFPGTRTFPYASPMELAQQIVASYHEGNILVGSEQLAPFQLDSMGRVYSDLYVERLAARCSLQGG
jgi:hypothetical protein